MATPVQNSSPSFPQTQFFDPKRAGAEFVAARVEDSFKAAFKPLKTEGLGAASKALAGNRSFQMLAIGGAAFKMAKNSGWFG